MKMEEMLRDKKVQEIYADMSKSNITYEEGLKIKNDPRIKVVIAKNLKPGNIIVAHYIGNDAVGLHKIDLTVSKALRIAGNMIRINDTLTLHPYTDCYIVNDGPITMSVTEAAKHLNLSRNRVYQLIKDNRIELYEGKPTINSIKYYELHRMPAGRPEGTFKKSNND